MRAHARTASNDGWTLGRSTHGALHPHKNGAIVGLDRERSDKFYTSTKNERMYVLSAFVEGEDGLITISGSRALVVPPFAWDGVPRSPPGDAK